ncbi:unnamed protein product, partial [Closterium sp. NIES-54]
AFPLNTQQHAWVTYHGPSQTLSVFLGGASSASATYSATSATSSASAESAASATYSDSSSASSTSTTSSTSSPVKPAVPVLTAHVDIPAILGATSASVGFTAGTWWWQWGANERHIIHDLAFVGGTFFETSNVTVELTARFDPANQTELADFTTASSSTSSSSRTSTSTPITSNSSSSTSISLASFTPDSTPPIVELHFTPQGSSSVLPGALRAPVSRHQITASRPAVRAHVYVSNMEDRPMADVAVTAHITYPNGTDASHCFVFSDPLLQGIDDVSGA